mgnify:CR=1 FL=1
MFAGQIVAAQEKNDTRDRKNEISFSYGAGSFNHLMGTMLGISNLHGSDFGYDTHNVNSQTGVVHTGPVYTRHTGGPRVRDSIYRFTMKKNIILQEIPLFESEKCHLPENVLKNSPVFINFAQSL